MEMEISEAFVKQVWLHYQQLAIMAGFEQDVSAMHVYVCPEQPGMDSVAVTMADGTYRFIRDGEVYDAAPF